MDLQSQINYLKAKQAASEAVHAVFIGVMIKLWPLDRRAFFDAVRGSFSSQASAGDLQSANNIKLACDQYVLDALDRVEEFVNQLDG
jgi:hypothetical protein